ncbi:MAG: methyl-accepting chemotaxis protein [Treponema sp.]|jgi:methyl-accepting chemotaxis protein|nr:methyl-accepting chemotaxis protein [Treponema sp.]
MKIFYSLKLQFITMFAIFILALCATTSVMGVREIFKVSSDIFSAQGIFVAEKAASLIDGNAFEALSKSLDINDPFYEETRITLLELKEFTSCLYLYTMAPVSGNRWRYIIDGSAPPEDTENFSELGTEEDTGSFDHAFQRVLQSGRTEASNLENQDEWGWMVSIYVPIKNSAGTIVGVVGCDYAANYVYEAIKREIIKQIIISLIFMAAGLLFVLALFKLIFSRLANVNNILKEISTGEGDLTRRITVRKQDEIGDLAKYFNLTLDKIKHLIVIIKNQAANLFTVGNELAVHMEQTAGAINQITGNIQGIKQKVTNQSTSITQTNSTMEQVTVNIDKLNKNVEAQTESVSQSSSAIEEMLANVQSVTQTLVRNAENVHELISVSDEGRTSLQKVSQDIQEIARESEGLLEINAVMQNIASQTNLLSMNAAIEAAHAGEAGRGFAVVADEIRKLAVNSGEQSKTISAVLKKIKTAIDMITVSTNTVLEKFKAIDERVQTVSEQESNIRSAMEEQGQGSQQILESVGKLNEITQMVKQGSEEMLVGSKEVIQESKNLESTSAEITGAMNEMSIGADQINEAVSRVAEISKTNKEHINTLFAEVSKFKVE